jgi:hypothetical protein
MSSLASPYVNIESQDRVLAPSALKASNLRLKFILRLRPTTLLLVMLPLLLLRLLLRLLLGEVARWFSRLLRGGGQRPLVPSGKALVLLALWLAVHSVFRPKALLRQ